MAFCAHQFLITLWQCNQAQRVHKQNTNSWDVLYSWAYVFKSGEKTCGRARLTLVSLVWVFCTIHLFCILHSSTDLHKNTKHLTSGVSLSKPTRADYSATTGSQTAGHNPTHVYPKTPKKYPPLQTKKIALSVALLYSTHGIQFYWDHSLLIALTIRTDKKKQRKKILQTFIGNDFEQ